MFNLIHIYMNVIYFALIVSVMYKIVLFLTDLFDNEK